jgi:integrase
MKFLKSFLRHEIIFATLPWPLPKDVKEAIDEYLKLDGPRRGTLHSDRDDAFLFQPSINYRTLEFDKPLSPRMVQKIVARWGEFTGIGRVTPTTYAVL